MTFEFVVCMTEQSSILVLFGSFFIIIKVVLMCVAARIVYFSLVLAVSFSTVCLSRDLEKD